ncbi:hypothetical protein GRI58_13240 [Porphyrobacter algicida]|uniref:Uncharacterized protein n=1 Tax=Qipengyuania algicida TaxID=1836209 RepID=A0A845AKT1_9SPHN|nr:hypothetical protein [Qipengyuania algicida]MXP29773.1 hypothetical protein [Qipengyuania algicida]
MHTEGETTHVNETEASGGSKEGVVRWVLGIGLLLAIVLLSIIWISGSASKNGAVGDESVSDKMQVEQSENEAADVLITPTPSSGDQVTHQDGLTVMKNDATPDGQ